MKKEFYEIGLFLSIFLLLVFSLGEIFEYFHIINIEEEYMPKKRWEDFYKTKKTQ